MTIQLHQGDCLEIMPRLAPASVDMILCDLPYGTTSNAWDSILDFNELWKNWAIVSKGRCVLFAAQPFTSALVMSNPKNYRHNWIWLKKTVTGFQNAKKMPLRCIEDVLVFGQGIYNPQGLIRCDEIRINSKAVGGGNLRGDVQASSNKGAMRTAGKEYVQEFTNYPRNVLEYGIDPNKVHPTQKPVALMEYLIRTYTNPGDVVLDNCMGSGTTGVACVNTGRSFIGIEREPEYFKIAQTRIREAEFSKSLRDAEELMRA